MAALAVVSCTGSEPPELATSLEVGATEDSPSLQKSVCAGGPARCFIRVRTDIQGRIRRFVLPKGFGPADLASAYAPVHEGDELDRPSGVAAARV